MVKYQEYYCSINTLNTTIQKYGVAVIPNILNYDEIKQSRQEMWDYLGYLTQKFNNPITEYNQNSWVNYYHLCPLQDMLLQYWKVGHSQWVWNLRQHPQIIKIFSHFWQCLPEDLLVSFDAVSIHFPPEITKIGQFQQHTNDWYHVDQSSEKVGFHCLQSYINLYDTQEGDSTLSFLERSHLYHQDFFQHYQKKVTKDWYQFTSEELSFFSHCPEKAVLAPAGSLVLWDSRLVHQGILCSRNRNKSNIRAVVYICMTPRHKASEKQLRKKQTAFNQMRMTTHWPHQISRFPAYPKPSETINKQVNLVTESTEKLILSEVGYKLSGF